MADKKWKGQRSQLYRQMIMGAAALIVLRQVSHDEGYDKISHTAEQLAGKLTPNQAEKLLTYGERLSKSKRQINDLFEQLGPEEVFRRAFGKDFNITDVLLAPYGADFKISKADYDDLGEKANAFSQTFFTNGERVISEEMYNEEAKDAGIDAFIKADTYDEKIRDEACARFKSGYRRINISVGKWKPATTSGTEASDDLTVKMYQERVHELSHSLNDTLNLFNTSPFGSYGSNPKTDTLVPGIISTYPSNDIIILKNSLMTETIAGLEERSDDEYDIFGHSKLEKVTSTVHDFEKQLRMALEMHRKNAWDSYSEKLESLKNWLKTLEGLPTPEVMLNNNKRKIRELEGQESSIESSLANIRKSYLMLNDTRKRNKFEVGMAQKCISNLELAFILRTMEFDNVYKRLPEVAKHYSRCKVRPPYVQKLFDEYGIDADWYGPVGIFGGTLWPAVRALRRKSNT